MTISLSTAFADAQLNYTATAHSSSVSDLFGGGTLVLYSGSVPANANASLGSPTTLATFTFAAASSWTASTTATLTLDIPIATVTAAATGTASFWRILNSSGGVLLQGTAGISSADWILTSASISSGDQVQISGTPTIALPIT